VGAQGQSITLWYRFLAGVPTVAGLSMAGVAAYGDTIV
jgi:hypothetical protein